MSLDSALQDIYLRKISRRKDELLARLVVDCRPITGIEIHETRSYENIEHALSSPDFRPIRIGDGWGGGRNGWFRMSIVVPDAFRGREVVVLLEPGGEACVYLDGRPYAGLSRFHTEVVLTTKARGGERYGLVMDALSGKPWEPEDAVQPPSVLNRADIGIRSIEATACWYDLETLYLIARDLPRESMRRAEIIACLNKVVDLLEFGGGEEALAASCIKARAALKPLLAKPADASSLKLAVVGHSHIDCAWKWPYRETVRKCCRTFSTVMRLMELYPEYIFTQGQALLYSFVKENHPGLYNEIKARAAEGRWDVTGSMWVEADCNLSSGESLVRQVLKGKSFVRDEFGVETNVLWLPDVFGYSAALPQILKRARVDYFFTNKIHWSDFNTPPHGTFWWKGIDGSRVLAHFPPTPSYNNFPAPEWYQKFSRDWQDKGLANEVLFTYGWGDGGGGPEPRHLELLRRQMDLEGYPKLEHKTVPQFFADIDSAGDYAEWAGELYLEYHRGTYTSQAMNKKLNRRSELLLRDAELLSALAEPLGLDYPRDILDRQWAAVLSNQFHDIIPGTSIRQVYEETDAMYADALQAGEDLAGAALRRLAEEIDTSGEGEAIVVFNSLPWNRTDVAAVEAPAGDAAVVDQSGNEVPSQVTAGRLHFAASTPSMGCSVYRLMKRSPRTPVSELRAAGNSLENRFFSIELDEYGRIASLVHRQTGREVVAAGDRANRLLMFEDKPITWPAWDIDFYAEEKFREITETDSIEVVEQGPMRAAVEVSRSFSRSRLRQAIVLHSDIPRIDFETWVDWHEDAQCLRAAFPVAINSPVARYEIQFGNVERPTHSNTSWDFAKFEVCAHRWADLSEGDFGVSLMNDCKYGHSTSGNVMRLTLLRSPKNPDPQADMGEHLFTYSLMPHAGSYVDAETVRRAYELNVPLRAEVVPSSPGRAPEAGLEVDAANVVLETVKKAEREEALILRLYECHNRRSKVNVRFRLPFAKVFECDLLEDNIDDGRPVTAGSGGERSFSFEIRPFEIRTFKLAES